MTSSAGNTMAPAALGSPSCSKLARRAGPAALRPRGDLWAAPHAKRRRAELGQRPPGLRGDLEATLTQQASAPSLASDCTAVASTSRPPITMQAGTPSSASSSTACAAPSGPPLPQRAGPASPASSPMARAATSGRPLCNRPSRRARPAAPRPDFRPLLTQHAATAWLRPRAVSAGPCTGLQAGAPSTKCAAATGRSPRGMPATLGRCLADILAQPPGGLAAAPRRAQQATGRPPRCRPAALAAAARTSSSEIWPTPVCGCPQRAGSRQPLHGARGGHWAALLAAGRHPWPLLCGRSRTATARLAAAPPKVRRATGRPPRSRPAVPGSGRADVLVRILARTGMQLQTRASSTRPHSSQQAGSSTADRAAGTGPPSSQQAGNFGRRLADVLVQSFGEPSRGSPTTARAPIRPPRSKLAILCPGRANVLVQVVLDELLACGSRARAASPGTAAATRSARRQPGRTPQGRPPTAAALWTSSPGHLVSGVAASAEEAEGRPPRSRLAILARGRAKFECPWRAWHAAPGFAGRAVGRTPRSRPVAATRPALLGRCPAGVLVRTLGGPRKTL